MNPGPPRILTCPHCGKKKEVLTLASGNTFDQELWSDNKKDLPSLPSPSLVQRCPHCEEYFLLSRQTKEEYGNGFSTNEGKLPFYLLKEAFEKLALSLEFTDEERQEILFNLIWAYNDRYNSTEESGRTTTLLPEKSEEIYYEGEIEVPHVEGGNWVDDDYYYNDVIDVVINDDSKEEESKNLQKAWEEKLEEERRELLRKEIASDADRRFFEQIVLELLENITDSLLRAEYLREIGHFEAATSELERANPTEEFLIKVKAKIAELIALKDTKVFSLTHLYYN